MAHVLKDAFIWTRQFTHPQLQRLNRVQNVRRWLDSKMIDLSRFARCQLQDTDKRYKVYHTFDGVWDGKPAYIEPRLRPLFIDYAVAVYAQAIAKAHRPMFAIPDSPAITSMMTAVPPADEASREHIYPGLQIMDIWPEPENDIDS